MMLLMAIYALVIAVVVAVTIEVLFHIAKLAPMSWRSFFLNTICAYAMGLSIQIIAGDVGRVL